MSWADFYAVCFLVGFLLSAVSFLVGGFQDHGPHYGHDAYGGVGRGDPPAAHAHLVHGHGHHNFHGFPFFNFATGSAFLAWFGGTGFLVTRYSSLWVWTGVIVSVVTGLVGAAFVFWFVAKVLMKHERDLDPADYDMVGVLGRVSSGIRGGGTGEIVFSQEGARRAASARSEDGSPIPAETEVVVTRYENGIAFVRRWEELLQ